MEEKEWTMSKDVEDIVFRQSLYGNQLVTLKHAYKIFKGLIKDYYFEHPPEAILKERTEEGKITYIFEYKFIDKDGDRQRDMLVAKTPDNPRTNWSIHQVLSIMQDMYILKLNEQILNKEDENGTISSRLEDKIDSGEYRVSEYDINDEQPH
mgnify:CR=1 FL=1